MNIILNHKHDTEVQSQLDGANHLARTRIVNIHDVYYAIAVLNQKFKSCSKKSMEGLTVRVDLKLSVLSEGLFWHPNEYTFCSYL